MRNLLTVIACFSVTILCWGVYGPVLHIGQEGMSTGVGMARLRPFVCVGLAYFLIGVLVPLLILLWRGEEGHWTVRGIIWSFAAGALGAVGALGIILAFTFGGRPSYVMPLVFGGAPVVNAFLTIYWAKKMHEIGPLFLAGLIMVVLGAVTVLIAAPRPPKTNEQQQSQLPHTEEQDVAFAVRPVHALSAVESAAVQPVALTTFLAATEGTVTPPRRAVNFVWQLLAIAMTVIGWGTYGPVLHTGQAAMQASRWRPLICVGLAYFAVAVIVPNVLLTTVQEASQYTFRGTLFSLAAGAAGAMGALGVILAFNFGGKPVYVMPLIFGGAPVVNTFVSLGRQGTLDSVDAFFLAGLILVIAGAAIVLVFAPRGAPPRPAETKTSDAKSGATTDQQFEHVTPAPSETTSTAATSEPAEPLSTDDEKDTS